MTRMTLDQAVDFIVNGLDVPSHEKRATRDKVRKRVRGGLGDGKLPRLDLDTMDVSRDELIYWARKKWPGKFLMPIKTHAGISEQLNIAVKTDGQQYPSDIERCHALLRQMQWLLQMLEAKSAAQERIIEDLRPDAARYRQNRDKNRISAAKPRS